MSINPSFSYPLTSLNIYYKQKFVHLIFGKIDTSIILYPFIYDFQPLKKIYFGKPIKIVNVKGITCLEIFS